MGASGWVYIEVDEIKRETEKAFLVIVDEQEVWLPKSQVEDEGEHFKQGDTDVEIGITEWIAREKGLG